MTDLVTPWMDMVTYVVNNKHTDTELLVSDTTPQSPDNTYSNDRLVDNSGLASTDKEDDDSIISEDDEDDILLLLAKNKTA